MLGGTAVWSLPTESADADSMFVARGVDREGNFHGFGKNLDVACVAQGAGMGAITISPKGKITRSSISSLAPFTDVPLNFGTDGSFLTLGFDEDASKPRVSRYDANGELLWRTDVDDTSQAEHRFTSIDADESRIVMANSVHGIVMFDRGTGAITWKKPSCAGTGIEADETQVKLLADGTVLAVAKVFDCALPGAPFANTQARAQHVAAIYERDGTVRTAIDLDAPPATGPRPPTEELILPEPFNSATSTASLFNANLRKVGSVTVNKHGASRKDAAGNVLWTTPPPAIPNPHIRGLYRHRFLLATNDFVAMKYAYLVDIETGQVLVNGLLAGEGRDHDLLDVTEDGILTIDDRAAGLVTQHHGCVP